MNERDWRRVFIGVGDPPKEKMTEIFFKQIFFNNTEVWWIAHVALWINMLLYAHVHSL